MSAGKVGAIVVGLIGIILVSVSGIALASNSDGFCHNCELKNESMSVDNTTSVKLYNKCCTPFTMAEKTFSLLALISGSFMWSISSGKVYDLLFYFFFPIVTGD